MTIVKGFAIAVIALLVGSWAEPARADEAFVCEGGRIVYVKPGQLETVKQADPCVARYFESAPHVRKDAAVSLSPLPAPPTAASVQVPAALANDSRYMRIINAAPGADGWFRLR
jgi:hypothetical protein